MAQDRRLELGMNQNDVRAFGYVFGTAIALFGYSINASAQDVSTPEGAPSADGLPTQNQPADGPGSVPPSASWLSVRLAPIPLILEWWRFEDQTFALGTGEIGYQFELPILVEANFTGWAGKTRLGWSTTLRGGYVFALHGPVNPRTGGVRGRFVPTLGYRYSYHPPSGGTGGRPPNRESHDVQGLVAYDLMWGSTVSFNARLHAGMAVSLASEKLSGPGRGVYVRDNSFDTSFSLGLTLGMSFAFVNDD